MNLSIETIKNGILLKTQYSETEFYANCEELFNALLLKIEGRGRFFSNDSYGYVHIFYNEEESFTAPVSD